jgi:hypothetical protein
MNPEILKLESQKLFLNKDESYQRRKLNEEFIYVKFPRLITCQVLGILVTEVYKVITYF